MPFFQNTLPTSTCRTNLEEGRILDIFWKKGVTHYSILEEGRISLILRCQLENELICFSCGAPADILITALKNSRARHIIYQVNHENLV